MELEMMEAAQYRDLDIEALNARRDAIVRAYDADDADFDFLDGELRRCADEYDRRNKQAQIRSLQISEVKGGAGDTIERTVTLDGVENRSFYDSDEYKRSFMEYVKSSLLNPPILQRDGTTTTELTGTSTGTSDFDNQITNAVMIPTTMGREIIRKMREYGNIWPKVRKLNIKGGMWFRIADLKLTATWIDDDHVSNYQKAQDGDKIQLSFFQLECRFSQTLLSAAVLWDDFQAMFAEAVAEAMVNAIEQAIVRGKGAEYGQPLGIIKDPRIMGVKNDAGTAYTTRPEAAIVEMGPDDVDDWRQWRRVLLAVPKLYRNKGEFMFGDLTWGLHIDMLEDKDGKPLAKFDPLNDAEPYKIMGRPCSLFEEEILPSFDDAEDGEVFGIYGDLRNYLMNTQPGMPLSVVKWVDHDDNRVKTKALVAMDGRVIEPFGFAVLVKRASSGMKVSPEADSTTMFGHAVSSLQSGVAIGRDLVIGTLKKVTTGALANDWGAGHFLAVKFSGEYAAGAKVGLEPSVSSGLVQLDDDMNAVFKVSSPKQKLVVEYRDAAGTARREYDLSGLTLEA